VNAVTLPTDAPKGSKRIKYPIQIILLAALYFAGGWIGLRQDFYQESVTLIWPPSGLSLAALILYGRRLWPGVMLGALLLNILHGSTVPISLAISVGNTLEALVSSWLMVDYFDFRPTLARVRDVAVLLVIGGALATIISAGNGVTTLWLAGNVATDDFFSVMLLWWLGDLGGVVALTPFLLLLRNGSPAWSILIRDLEFWIVTSLLIVSCLLAFGGIAHVGIERLAMQLPLPCLAWAGIRLGTRGTVVVSFSTIAIAATATAQGLGPLAANDPHVSTILLWAYGTGMGATALTLAAAIAQRNSAEHRHRLEIEQRERSERENLLSAERERIMREMHDGLGGQLVSVLSMVQRGQASADEVAEALRRSLDDMRIVIDSLETRESNFPELLGKLRARLEPLLQRNGVRLQWRVDDIAQLGHFGPEEALHCVRIIQEATANVIQHARATKIDIEISIAGEDRETMVIEIRDDGIDSIPGSQPGGRGTRNMIDRARALGGALRIEPAEPGRRVRVSIPINERSADQTNASK